MVEVQFIVPVADNSGQPFTAEHDAKFTTALMDRFGGYSRLPGLVAGGWRDGGDDYFDDARLYVVAVNGIIGKAADLLATAEEAKRIYGQLAIYVRYLNVSEVL